MYQGLVEVSKKKAYDNLKVVQYEGKNSVSGHQVIAGDKGNSYLRGSSSMPQSPPLMKFHGQHLVHSNHLCLFPFVLKIFLSCQ
jgi:hypothetical protein